MEDLGKTIFALLLIIGVAMIFPILYDDVLVYNSNKTIGPFIESFPIIFIGLFAGFIAVLGWRKRNG